MLDEFTDPELTSLVLKRVPPRCTSTVLLDMLDACGGLYDFVHLPYDIRHHKNLSLAFINFLDHEGSLCMAVRAFELPTGTGSIYASPLGPCPWFGTKPVTFCGTIWNECFRPPLCPICFH
ncbi:ML1 [Symbiodinium necroappetens]|uniref:ML1 protein n=1 Tax=Symbiodinium necroappetens TaxID=1628268 RepID=A0A812SI87_9DINO|nr:ML1 [Symbiodinium necroappetens]